jgi:hypothetical protein
MITSFEYYEKLVEVVRRKAVFINPEIAFRITL